MIKYCMRFTKTQQEVYDNLMAMLKQQGRAYMLGWALGQLIRLSTQDPQLRRLIADRAKLS